MRSCLRTRRLSELIRGSCLYCLYCLYSYSVISFGSPLGFRTSAPLVAVQPHHPTSNVDHPHGRTSPTPLPRPRMPLSPPLSPLLPLRPPSHASPYTPHPMYIICIQVNQVIDIYCPHVTNGIRPNNAEYFPSRYPKGSILAPGICRDLSPSPSPPASPPIPPTPNPDYIYIFIYYMK